MIVYNTVIEITNKKLTVLAHADNIGYFSRPYFSSNFRMACGLGHVKNINKNSCTGLGHCIVQKFH